MKLLILAALAAAATAATLPRQGYSLPQPATGFTLGSVPGQSLHTGGIGQTTGLTTGFVTGGQVPGFATGGITTGGISTGGIHTGSVGATSPTIGHGGSCPEGQLPQVDGSCVTPIVRRNLFVYRAPSVAPIIGPRPDVAPPRIEHNIVFIHTPEGGVFGNDPVVVPPPQQKNVIYVLNKRPEIDHSVLEFPPPEQVAPEIFFINYADGENPTLPSGGDLRSALSQASESAGEVIGHKDAIVSTGTGVSGIGVGTGVGTGVSLGTGVGVGTGVSVGTGLGVGTGVSTGPSGLYSTP